MGNKGSSKAGPSKAYLRLLKGSLSSKDYTSKVKRSVDREVGRIGRSEKHATG
jgi:hypothetical protein